MPSDSPAGRHRVRERGAGQEPYGPRGKPRGTGEVGRQLPHREGRRPNTSEAITAAGNVVWERARKYANAIASVPGGERRVGLPTDKIKSFGC
jgi:hypothetical protein